MIHVHFKLLVLTFNNNTIKFETSNTFEPHHSFKNDVTKK